MTTREMRIFDGLARHEITGWGFIKASKEYPVTMMDVFNTLSTTKLERNYLYVYPSTTYGTSDIRGICGDPEMIVHENTARTFDEGILLYDLD